MQTQLMLLALHNKAGRTARHKKRRKPLAVHFSEHDEQVREARVRNPDFVAVEQVVLIMAFGAGACGKRVGACFRLGQGVSANKLPPCEEWQILLGLRFRAEQ